MMNKYIGLPNQSLSWLHLCLFFFTMFVLSVKIVMAAPEIYSIKTDSDQIILKGNNELTTSATYQVNGVSISKDSSPDPSTVILSPLDLAGVVILGSNSLKIIETGAIIFFYSSKSFPVIMPPPPPPPPPPSSDECPCATGWHDPANWSNSIVPTYESVWCTYGVDGTQKWWSSSSWIDNSGRTDFFATAFDPNNILFYLANVENSESFCALHDGSSYIVAEPVVNWNQYNDCVLEMKNFCFW